MNGRCSCCAQLAASPRFRLGKFCSRWLTTGMPSGGRTLDMFENVEAVLSANIVVGY